jgi:hypothetical protein
LDLEKGLWLMQDFWALNDKTQSNCTPYPKLEDIGHLGSTVFAKFDLTDIFWHPKLVHTWPSWSPHKAYTSGLPPYEALPEPQPVCEGGSNLQPPQHHCSPQRNSGAFTSHQVHL